MSSPQNQRQSSKRACRMLATTSTAHPACWSQTSHQQSLSWLQQLADPRSCKSSCFCSYRLISNRSLTDEYLGRCIPLLTSFQTYRSSRSVTARPVVKAAAGSSFAGCTPPQSPLSFLLQELAQGVLLPLTAAWLFVTLLGAVATRARQVCSTSQEGGGEVS